MSQRNGEKARANLQKRRRTAMRLKTRAGRAASQSAPPSAAPTRSGRSRKKSE